MKYMGLLHELNSPIASLQAILYTNQNTLPPALHQKLSHHLRRLIQASTVLSEGVSQDPPSTDQLIRLLKIWLELHETPIQEFNSLSTPTALVLTHPISGSTSKTEYSDLIWTICKRQTKQLGGRLTKTATTITLSLPHHLQP